MGHQTRQDVKLFGPAFSRAWPVEQAPDFTDLLRAIDRADEQVRHEENAGRPN